MEKEQQPNERVHITKAVFDGLEAIRQSGATNMLDRPVVLRLAKEWDLTATADWIENVDTGTYGRLILGGPEIIEDESLDEKLDRMDREYDEERRGFWEGKESSIDTALEDESARLHDLITKLGKRASLTFADTYETEQMGVPFDPSRRAFINAERDALMRNLVEASNLRRQLEETVSEIERGIASLRYMIDPENN